jgi:Family of unknown function (DUF6459)
MQHNPPPPQLPWHIPELPARPAVVPVRPAKVVQPGSQAGLPDTVAIRQVAVPETAPPFDDEDPEPGERPDSPGLGRSEASGSARPALQAPVTSARAPGLAPFGGPPSAGADPPAPADRPEPGDEPGRSADPGRLGSAAGWPTQFAQALAEALAGARPVQQLRPWTTEQARRRIRQLGPMLATDQRPRVRRVMTSVPARDVLEMTAVVGFGPRVLVLALRLERQRAGADRGGAESWCCTAIESA